MYCKHCGKENLDIAKFCKKCGGIIDHHYYKTPEFHEQDTISSLGKNPDNIEISVRTNSEPSYSTNHRKWNVKTILWIAGILIFVAVAYFYPSESCNLPVKYSVGSVDPRFNISQDDILKLANDSANKWNTQTSKSLLVYDPNATMKINFVYDQRQADTDSLKNKIANLDQSSGSIDSWKSNLQSSINSYERDLNQYNSDVNYWNRRGGAPNYAYNQLSNQSYSLEQRRQQINKSLNLLDIEINEHNSNLGNLNTQIEQNKDKVETEGAFFSDQNKIDIYIVDTQDELRLLLMHEMGHSIGLDHDKDPKSIMYYLLADQDFSNLQLTTEDINMLNSTCGLQ